MVRGQYYFTREQNRMIVLGATVHDITEEEWVDQAIREKFNREDFVIKQNEEEPNSSPII